MSKKNLQVRARIRAKVSGTAARPRLHVHISNNNVQAELIDDVTQKTLVAVTTTAKKAVSDKATSLTAKAGWAGTEIATLAKAKKIKSVVFDRGTRTYHGRVKAFAEAARTAGLEF